MVADRWHLSLFLFCFIFCSSALTITGNWNVTLQLVTPCSACILARVWILLWFLDFYFYYFPVQVGSHGAVLCLRLFFWICSWCTAGGVSAHQSESFVLWPVALRCFFCCSGIWPWSFPAKTEGWELLRVGNICSAWTWILALICAHSIEAAPVGELCSLLSNSTVGDDF